MYSDLLEGLHGNLPQVSAARMTVASGVLLLSLFPEDMPACSKFIESA